jgi:hypothetical protein
MSNLFAAIPLGILSPVIAGGSKKQTINGAQKE